MSELAIDIKNLGKLYRIGSQERYKTLRDAIANTFTTPWRRVFRQDAEKDNVVNYIWALRNISFSIKKGEVVGIIGRNGAGKSTLLKILSRITPPTEGGAEVYGRVGSLLEVGTGFHPELTGRDNIYLSGAVLGMKKSEIKRKFDEIVNFAEVEKFIDMPLKHYSSGMYVRLAFAVAAHLEPDILLVDEVLAVGDFAFQRKCLDKMENIAGRGRTILFVSHNMFSVQNLCSRAIVLSEGRISLDGNVHEVINQYIGQIKSQGGEISWVSPDVAPGDVRARLKGMRIISEGRVNADIGIDKEFKIEVDYWNLKVDNRLMVSLHIYTSMGVCVLTSGNLPSACIAADKFAGHAFPRGLFRTSCVIPPFLLNDGLYKISLYLMINNLPRVSQGDTIAYLDGVLAFNIIDTGVMSKEYTGKWWGVIRPRLNWQTEKLD